jgi:nucleoside-diphosphate-sugar epimerase
MSRVLVVGGASFIASHTLPRLVASGREVHATYRGDISPRTMPELHWISSDLTSPDPTSHWPASSDAVIYLAQSREWRRFPDGAADVFDVNVRAVLSAAAYAVRAGASHFIFASTGSVYGKLQSPARERDALEVIKPRPFYEAAKLSAELMLRSYVGRLNVVILRLFVPYGDREAPDMLIPQLVNKVRSGAPIQLDGQNGLIINPVAAGDVAESIERSLGLEVSATLNVAGPEALSLRQVGEAIGRVLGHEPRFESRSGEAPMIVGDRSAMEQALGWVPRTTFEDGLRAWLHSKS